MGGSVFCLHPKSVLLQSTAIFGSSYVFACFCSQFSLKHQLNTHLTPKYCCSPSSGVGDDCSHHNCSITKGTAGVREPAEPCEILNKVLGFAVTKHTHKHTHKLKDAAQFSLPENQRCSSGSSSSGILHSSKFPNAEMDFVLKLPCTYWNTK